MGIQGEIEAAGARLAVVGSGSVEQAADFVEKFPLSGSVYVDPERTAYRAFSLLRGVGRTLGPRVLMRGLSAFGSGFRQGQMAGDPWQQGGTFVIAPGGRVLFAHRDQSAGDHADLDRVVRACRQ